MRRHHPALMIAAMAATPLTVSLRLDLQPEGIPISGCIEHADGTRRPFWSWLELMAELEAAVAQDATRPHSAWEAGHDHIGEPQTVTGVVNTTTERGGPSEVIADNNQEFVKAIAAGDATAAAAVYTEKARLLAPDFPMVEGREQIRGFWQSGMSSGISGATLTTESVDVRDDLAVEVGRYRLRLEAAGGDGGTADGKYVVIHRRTESGDWKWDVDIFNSDGRARSAALVRNQQREA